MIVTGDKFFCLNHWRQISPDQQAALFLAIEAERASALRNQIPYPDEDWEGVEERDEERRLSSEVAGLFEEAQCIHGNPANAYNFGEGGAQGFSVQKGGTGNPGGRPRTSPIWTVCLNPYNGALKYQGFRQLNLCANCHRAPRLPGCTRCAQCQERQRQGTLRRAAERIEHKCCAACGDDADGGCWRCRQCLALRRAAQRKSA